MRSAPCYPASQISAGKSTEIFALPPSYPTAQGRIKARVVETARDESLEAAAIKISVAFYKNCAAIFYTDKSNISA
jgi:hypothetical protein